MQTLSIAVAAIAALCLGSSAVAADTSSHPEVLKNAPLVITGEMKAIQETNRQSIARHGYVDRPTEVSGARRALDLLVREEQYVLAAQKSPGGARPLPERRFWRLGKDTVPKLGVSMGALPEGFVPASASGYVFSPGAGATRVFSDSVLGTLMIREYPNGKLFVDGPTKMGKVIAGTTVYVTTIRYQGGDWATLAVAAKADRILEVEVGDRVDSPANQALFEQLIASLLEGV